MKCSLPPFLTLSLRSLSARPAPNKGGTSDSGGKGVIGVFSDATDALRNNSPASTSDNFFAMDEGLTFLLTKGDRLISSLANSLASEARSESSSSSPPPSSSCSSSSFFVFLLPAFCFFFSEERYSCKRTSSHSVSRQVTISFHVARR